MQTFTDLKLAMKYAHNLADTVRGGQRRSAYLVQKGHIIKVNNYKPKRADRVMCKVEPKNEEKD